MCWALLSAGVAAWLVIQRLRSQGSRLVLSSTFSWPKVDRSGTAHLELFIKRLVCTIYSADMWFINFVLEIWVKLYKSWIKISLIITVPPGTILQEKKIQNCLNVKIIWQLYQYLQVEMMFSTLWRQCTHLILAHFMQTLKVPLLILY